MVDLPDEPSGVFKPFGGLSLKPLLLLLLLLLLLGNVTHNQSLTSPCPNQTAVAGFGNFSSAAGSPFSFEIRIPATAGQTRHHQLSLADEEGPLPRWMVFRHQTSSLVGLGLREDCGAYRLKVSVAGQRCGRAAFFYLHILDQTENNEHPQSPAGRDVLASSVWAKLLLQLDPESLNASQRMFLVSALTDVLRLPPGFVRLFSRNRSFLLRQERLRVCWQGGLAGKLLGEEQGVRGEVGELVWPAGCQGEEERQSDWAAALEESTDSGSLTRLLGAPVLGWRLLCAGGGAQHEVKRDTQRQKHTPTPNMIGPTPTHKQGLKIVAASVQTNHMGTTPSPPFAQNLMNTFISISKDFAVNSSDAFSDSSLKAFIPERLSSITEEKRSSAFPPIKTIVFTERTYTFPERSTCADEALLAALHAPNCEEFACCHLDGFPSFPVRQTEERTDSRPQTLAEVTRRSEHILGPRSEAPLLPIINSGRMLTSEATAATSTIHAESQTLAYLLHLGPSLFTSNLSPFRPERASAVRNSVGTAFVQEPLTSAGLSSPPAGPHSLRPPLPLRPAPSTPTVDRESLVARLTSRPRGKETPHPSGPYRASRSESDRHSAVSSPGLVICSPLPAPSEESVSVQSSAVLAQQHATIPYPSPAPSPLHVEPASSALSALLPHTPLEPSMTRFAPSLPSEVWFPSGQLEAPRTSPPLFSVETLTASASPSPSSSLPNASASDVASQAATGLQSKSEVGSLLQTRPTLPKQTHPASSRIISAALMVLGGGQGVEEKTTASRALFSGSKDSSAREAVQFEPSAEQTVPHTKLIKESRDVICVPLMPSKNKKTSVVQTKSEPCPHVALAPGMTSRTYFNTEFLTTVQPGVMPGSLTALESFAPVDEGHFEPTAPSAAQQACTASSTPPTQTLQPSSPSRGDSTAQDQADGSDCAPPLDSAQPENTKEHVPDFSTSSFVFEPHKEESHWTASSSRFIEYDSSERILSTNGDAGVESSSYPTGFFSDVLGESEWFTSLLWVSAMDLTPAMTPGSSDFRPLLTSSASTSSSSPLMGSGFSSLSRSKSVPGGNGLSLDTSSFICQSTDADSGSLVAVCPLVGRSSQILSASLSQYYGVSSTLTASHATLLRPSSRRQSFVQQSHPSTSTFSLMNLPPKVLESIPALMATVGFPFRYAIPPKTFLDPEDGQADALSLEMRFIDGPPPSTGSWLTLDGLELHGVPLEADLQFAPQHLILAARDSQGLSAWLPLTLDLQRSPADPCHLFTLTFHLSLHSILRHRRRVELLLEKLSRFFNSSGDHHLSIVSMSPGSTVVSLYNYSLCEMGRSRVRLCHVGQIRSMWLAMGSADGRVNPAFREAMLPEFPIAEVGPVSYRQDCFTTSVTPTFTEFTTSVSSTLHPSSDTDNPDPSPSPSSITTFFTSVTTTATAQPVNSYRWMVAMLAALLVICLLILVVILVSAVLYFRRGYQRTRTVAIWPAGGMLSARDMDRQAIRPRLPPLFQRELPPPPLELWINLKEGDEWPLPSTRVQGNV